MNETVVERIWKKFVKILEITVRELSPFFFRLKIMRTQIRMKNPRQKTESLITLKMGLGQTEHSSLAPL